MATRYIDQANQQLAPVYDQQIRQLEKQVPAIQNLYASLTEGLQTQNQQQIAAGTQNIVEDASARGVLRSTLPVDARQALIGQLGVALNQGLGQLGLQRVQDIGAVRSQIGSLGTQKAKDIADLARALESQDIQQQELALKRLQADRDYQLSQQQIARSGGGAAPAFNPAIAAGIDQTLSRLVGKDGKVSPNNYNQAKVLWASQGGNPDQFNKIFGPKYAEGAKSPIMQYYGYNPYK